MERSRYCSCCERAFTDRWLCIVTSVIWSDRRNVLTGLWSVSPSSSSIHLFISACLSQGCGCSRLSEVWCPWSQLRLQTLPVGFLGVPRPCGKYNPSCIFCLREYSNSEVPVWNLSLEKCWGPTVQHWKCKWFVRFSIQKTFSKWKIASNRQITEQLLLDLTLEIILLKT